MPNSSSQTVKESLAALRKPGLRARQENGQGVPSGKPLWNERALAGDAAPDATLLDPGIGETDTVNVLLAFAGAGFAINSDNHGSIAVDGDGQAFVVEMIRLVRSIQHVFEVFSLVFDAAVEIHVAK